MAKIYGFALELRHMRYYQSFKKLAGRILRIPSKTRWNGWYLMLLKAGELRPAINQLIDEYPKLEQYRLHRSD